MSTIIKLLWIIALILTILSGFKLRINSLEFEWTGILEQLYNIIEDRRNKIN